MRSSLGAVLGLCWKMAEISLLGNVEKDVDGCRQALYQSDVLD